MGTAVEVERRAIDRLLAGVGADDLEVNGIPPARHRGEDRGRRHVTEKSTSGRAAVVGDPTDPRGDDDEEEIVALEAQTRRPAMRDHREGPTVPAAEPIQAERPAASHPNFAGQLAGGPPGPLPCRLVGREVPPGNRRGDEGGRDEDDPPAVGEVAARFLLEPTDGLKPHRDLVVDGDRPGLDPGVLRELPRDRVAKPPVLQLPDRLIDGDRSDAERGGRGRFHGRCASREGAGGGAAGAGGAGL